MKFEVVRYIDKLGRICIPIDVRRAMGVTEQSAIIIEVTADGVLLRKKEPLPGAMTPAPMKQEC